MQDTNATVMSLQYFPPVFHEVNCVYDAEGTLVARCISHFKTTLRGGFRINYVDSRKYGEVPFTTPSVHHHRLIGTQTGREIGSFDCLSGVPAASGQPIRYAVTAGEAVSEEPQGHFFLLAAAATFALRDFALKQNLTSTK